MKSYEQFIQHGIASSNKTPKEKAFALNLFEAMLDESMTDDDIVNAVANDELPERFVVVT